MVIQRRQTIAAPEDRAKFSRPILANIYIDEAQYILFNAMAAIYEAEYAEKLIEIANELTVDVRFMSA